MISWNMQLIFPKVVHLIIRIWDSYQDLSDGIVYFIGLKGFEKQVMSNGY